MCWATKVPSPEFRVAHPRALLDVSLAHHAREFSIRSGG